ncbi:hypothetical protein HK101_006727 [Irineochytrium annulatum]|nr:hypothetical protein HK101_006727 [Irineochytrium annulatum]
MSVLPLLYQGLIGGGPQGMLVTWPVISLLSAFVAASMSEIVSSYPTSGGLYYWSASLAGPKWAPFASYMTGYFNSVGLAGLASGTAYAFGQFLANIFILCNVFQAGTWASKLVTLFGGFLAMYMGGSCALVGSKGIDMLGKFCFWLNAIGLAVICISCVAASPVHVSLAQLFSNASWNNATGLPDSWAGLISILLATLTYTGYDSAAHLAEETNNVAIQGPRSIAMAMVGTFVSGYFALFCLLSTIDPSNDGYTALGSLGPFALTQIFLNTVGNAGAIAFNVLLMMIAITNIFGLVATHARQTFAFSRDGALPGSNWLHKLNENAVPVRATYSIMIFDSIILLPSLYSSTLYFAINSFGVIGTYLAYAIPIALRVANHRHFPPGPFSLGAAGLPVAVVAIIFLLVSSVVLILPTNYTDPTEFDYNQTMPDGTNVTMSDNNAYVTAYLQNFNWAPAMVFAVAALSLGFWFGTAKKWFKGPPIDTETEWDGKEHVPVRDMEEVGFPGEEKKVGAIGDASAKADETAWAVAE